MTRAFATRRLENRSFRPRPRGDNAELLEHTRVIARTQGLDYHPVRDAEDIYRCKRRRLARWRRAIEPPVPVTCFIQFEEQPQEHQFSVIVSIMDVNCMHS